MPIIYDCPSCKGTGVIKVPDPNKPIKTAQKIEVTCFKCHGSGQVKM